jgi:predicted amidohydrolase YtcJ
MSVKSVFLNGRLFCIDGANFAACMVVECGIISHVGGERDPQVQAAIVEGANVTDLKGHLVLPAFIDGHTHLLHFGLSMQKLDLGACNTLEKIQQAISDYAKQNPTLERILCRGWLQSSTNGLALASTLDTIDSRPIFIDSLDLHSNWCNTAALKELGLSKSSGLREDHLPCDSDGNPTGLLAEDAVNNYVWPHLLSSCSFEEQKHALSDAFAEYVKAGYAGAVDMAMDTDTWAALVALREEQAIPIHIAAYWLIIPSQDRSAVSIQLDHVIELQKTHHPSASPDFCIMGIKIVGDGTVDGCTAYLSYAYGDLTEPAMPIWTTEMMQYAVEKASSAGLQCAIHAIGDAAVSQAVNSIIATGGSSKHRHRIEHLELASETDSKRLREYGIIASVQPVHSDPDILRAYKQLVGKHAWDRAFAYQEFCRHGADLALGTDAPTARHLPFPNLYNATTRKSALDPLCDLTLNTANALTLSQAVRAASYGAAYARFTEGWTGQLSVGLRADFIVVDAVWEPEKLLSASVRQIWVKGRRIS